MCKIVKYNLTSWLQQGNQRVFHFFTAKDSAAVKKP